MENLKTGDVVLIKDEINPPLRWPLARVVNTYPGNDGLVRTVEVETGTKMYKRPVGKLVKLPVDTGNDQEAKFQVPSSIQASSVTPGCDETNSTPETNKRPKTRSTSSPAMLAFILIICGCISGICGEQQSNFSIMKFENAPGLYFERLENIQLIRDKWSIASAIDTTMYRKNFNTLVEAVYELEHLCLLKRTKSATQSCNSMFLEVSEKIEQIKHYNGLINMKKRSKRGIMAAGGAMALGWAASKVMSYFTDDSVDQRKLEQLLDSKISVLNKNEEIMRRNQEILQSGIKILVNQTMDIVEQLNTVARNVEMTERSQWVSAHILMMLSEFQNMQKLLLEIIVNQHKKLHPLWINAQNLEQQVELIDAHVSDGQLQLMGNTLEEKMMYIYQLARTEVTVLNNKILLIIEIPLVSNDYYENYVIWPVPFIINNELVTIETNAKVIVVNQNHTNYALINIVSAPAAVEIMYNVNIGMHCEAELLFKSNININKCKFKTIQSGEFWRQTYNKNWLFHIEKQAEVTIVYFDSEEKVNITGNGVFMLRGKSVLKTSSSEIRMENNEFISKNNMEFREFGAINRSSEYKSAAKTQTITLQELEMLQPWSNSTKEDQNNILIIGIICLFIVCAGIIYVKLKVRFITIEQM